MANLKKYSILLLVITMITIRYIPALFYSNGVFAHKGNELVSFWGTVIPYKWQVFVECELWAWLFEAVLVLLMLSLKHVRYVLRLIFAIWVLSRSFDITQYYAAIQVDITWIKYTLNSLIIILTLISVDLIQVRWLSKGIESPVIMVINVLGRTKVFESGMKELLKVTTQDKNKLDEIDRINHRIHVPIAAISQILNIMVTTDNEIERKAFSEEAINQLDVFKIESQKLNNTIHHVE